MTLQTRQSTEIGGGPTAKRRRPHAPTPSLLGHAQKNAGFGEIAEELKTAKSARNKPHSVDTMMSHLNRFGAFLAAQGLGLRDVRDLHLDRYVMHREQVDRVGDICRRRDIMYAKVLMAFAARRGYVHRDRIKGYDLPKAAKPYRKMPSPENIKEIVDAVLDKTKAENNPCHRYRNAESEKFFAARDPALILTGVATGCRIGEILRWTMDNYDPANNQFVVSELKNGKPRYVAIEPVLKPFLDRWLRQRGGDELYEHLDWFGGEDGAGEARPTLFMSEGGKPLDPSCWSRQFKRYCEWAKVEDVTFHSLRHYSVTQIYHVSPFAAQHQAGHDSIRTTETYSHNDAERQRAAVLVAKPLAKVLGAGKKRKFSIIRQ